MIFPSDADTATVFAVVARTRIVAVFADGCSLTALAQQWQTRLSSERNAVLVHTARTTEEKKGVSDESHGS